MKNLKTAIHTYCYGGDKKGINLALNFYRKMEINDIKIRRLGTAAIELGFIAAGRIESLTIPGLHSWDGGAGILLVRQAGGRVTDLKGQEWNLKSKDMVATNGKIHDQLLNFINKK
jgi:myo-inositol-1(or 4)-monophosphatase